LFFLGHIAAGKKKSQVAAQFSLSLSLAGTGAVSVSLATMIWPSPLSFFLAAFSIGAGYVLRRGFSYRILASLGFFGCVTAGLLWMNLRYPLLLDSLRHEEQARSSLALTAAWWALLCLGLVWGRLREKNWSLSPARSAIVAPCLHGLYVTLLLFILLATVAGSDIHAYPAFFRTMDLSAKTLGVAAGLGTVCLVFLLTRQFGAAPRTMACCLSAAVLTLPAGWLLPGLSLGLLGLAISRHAGSRVLTGMTGLFLFCYICHYYYSLNYSLLIKSLSLMGGGSMLLAMSALLRKIPADMFRPLQPFRHIRENAKRTLLVAAVLILLPAGFAWSALKMEKLREEGAVVLLELEPADPRALLMGDYMDLNYSLNREVENALKEEEETATEGLLIVRLDKNRVASFARIDDGTPLDEDELRLRFRRRSRHVQTAAEAFFFQEGDAEAYSFARYGELRVGKNGGSLLLYLLDNDLQRIVPEKPDSRHPSDTAD
jgi:uncharacterized membrane-anchored protein